MGLCLRRHLRLDHPHAGDGAARLHLQVRSGFRAQGSGVYSKFCVTRASTSPMACSECWGVFGHMVQDSGSRHETSYRAWTGRLGNSASMAWTRPACLPELFICFFSVCFCFVLCSVWSTCLQVQGSWVEGPCASSSVLPWPSQPARTARALLVTDSGICQDLWVWGRPGCTLKQIRAWPRYARQP